jgi:hypothetical protein
MIVKPSVTYYWTNHSKAKMAYYKISESRVRRVIKSPLRIEEGIAPNTIAYMQPVSYKIKNGKKVWNQELWVMVEKSIKKGLGGKIKVISAWRYPGVTKPQSPLPKAILDEIREGLDNC